VARRLPLLAAATLGGCATLPTHRRVGLDQRRTLQTAHLGNALAPHRRHGRPRRQGRFAGAKTVTRSTTVPTRSAPAFCVMGQPDALIVTARGETRTLADPEAELS
jgi:hypothetical protein